MAQIVRDGITRFSIFDPATGTTVTGTGILSSSGFVEEKEFFVTGQGRRRILRNTRSVTLDMIDVENLYQIHAWRDDETPVQAVLLGVASDGPGTVEGRNMQLYTSCLLDSVPLSGSYGNNAVERVTLFTKDVNASWYNYVNLLQYKGWDTITAGTPDLPENWSLTETGATTLDDTAVFNGDNLELEISDSGAGGNVALYTDVPVGLLPTGVDFTFGLEVVTVGTDPQFDEIQLRIYEVDQAGATGSSTVSTYNPPSTGRKSVTHTTADSDLYSIRCEMKFAYSGAATADQTDVKLPSLKLGSNKDETRY